MLQSIDFLALNYECKLWMNKSCMLLPKFNKDASLIKILGKGKT